MDEAKPAQTGVIRVQSKSKRILVFVFVLVLAAIMSGVGAWLYEKNKPALKIGDTKISKTQFNKYVEQAAADPRQKNNKSEVKDIVIKFEKAKIAAKELGININASDIDTELRYAGLSEKKDKITDWQRLFAENGAISAKLETNVQPGYEGYRFELPFSRHFLSSQPKPDDPQFNDEKAIEEDRKYAENKAKEIRQKILDKSISLDDAVKAIKEDKRLVYGPASNQTGAFSIDEQGKTVTSGNTGNYLPKMFLEMLPAIKDQSVSEVISPVQKNRDATQTKIIERPVAYYFLYRTGKRAGDPEIKKKFDDKIKSIKVVDNV